MKLTLFKPKFKKKLKKILPLVFKLLLFLIIIKILYYFYNKFFRNIRIGSQIERFISAQADNNAEYNNNVLKDLPPINAFAFKGGGMQAVITHTGIISALCLETENNLSNLCSNIKAITGNSGGTWFINKLFCKDDNLEKYVHNQNSPTCITNNMITDHNNHKNQLVERTIDQEMLDSNIDNHLKNLIYNDIRTNIISQYSLIRPIRVKDPKGYWDLKNWEDVSADDKGRWKRVLNMMDDKSIQEFWDQIITLGTGGSRSDGGIKILSVVETSRNDIESSITIDRLYYDISEGAEIQLTNETYTTSDWMTVTDVEHNDNTTIIYIEKDYGFTTFTSKSNRYSKLKYKVSPEKSGEKAWSEDFSWEDLNQFPGVMDALQNLGGTDSDGNYTKDRWDENVVFDYWEEIEWDELSEEDQQRWGLLGYTKYIWGMGDVHDNTYNWDELISNNLEDDAIQLGYNRESWDDDIIKKTTSFLGINTDNIDIGFDSNDITDITNRVMKAGQKAVKLRNIIINKIIGSIDGVANNYWDDYISKNIYGEKPRGEHDNTENLAFGDLVGSSRNTIINKHDILVTFATCMLKSSLLPGGDDNNPNYDIIEITKTDQDIINNTQLNFQNYYNNYKVNKFLTSNNFIPIILSNQGNLPISQSQLYIYYTDLNDNTEIWDPKLNVISESAQLTTGDEGKMVNLKNYYSNNLKIYEGSYMSSSALGLGSSLGWLKQIINNYIERLKDLRDSKPENEWGESIEKEIFEAITDRNDNEIGIIMSKTLEVISDTFKNGSVIASVLPQHEQPPGDVRDVNCSINNIEQLRTNKEIPFTSHQNSNNVVMGDGGYWDNNGIISQIVGWQKKYGTQDTISIFYHNNNDPGFMDKLNCDIDPENLPTDLESSRNVIKDHNGRIYPGVYDDTIWNSFGYSYFPNQTDLAADDDGGVKHDFLISENQEFFFSSRACAAPIPLGLNLPICNNLAIFNNSYNGGYHEPIFVSTQFVTEADINLETIRPQADESINTIESKTVTYKYRYIIWKTKTITNEYFNIQGEQEVYIHMIESCAVDDYSYIGLLPHIDPAFFGNLEDDSDIFADEYIAKCIAMNKCSIKFIKQLQNKYNKFNELWPNPGTTPTHNCAQFNNSNANQMQLVEPGSCMEPINWGGQ